MVEVGLALRSDILGSNAQMNVVINASIDPMLIQILGVKLLVYDPFMLKNANPD